MPLYDYECEDCGIEIEEVFKMDEKPTSIECGGCHSTMYPVMVEGHGGIQTDKPKWIDDSVRGALQGDDEKPIETRTDYNRALKEKNVEPIERG